MISLFRCSFFISLLFFAANLIFIPPALAQQTVTITAPPGYTDCLDAEALDAAQDLETADKAVARAVSACASIWDAFERRILLQHPRSGGNLREMKAKLLAPVRNNYEHNRDALLRLEGDYDDCLDSRVRDLGTLYALGGGKNEDLDPDKMAAFIPGQCQESWDELEKALTSAPNVLQEIRSEKHGNLAHRIRLAAADRNRKSLGNAQLSYARCLHGAVAKAGNEGAGAGDIADRMDAQCTGSRAVLAENLSAVHDATVELFPDREDIPPKTQLIESTINSMRSRALGVAPDPPRAAVQAKKSYVECARRALNRAAKAGVGVGEIANRVESDCAKQWAAMSGFLNNPASAKAENRAQIEHFYAEALQDTQ